MFDSRSSISWDSLTSSLDHHTLLQRSRSRTAQKPELHFSLAQAEASTPELMWNNNSKTKLLQQALSLPKPTLTTTTTTAAERFDVINAPPQSRVRSTL